MSTIELNKIAGAALFAGLIAMLAFVVSKEVFHTVHDAEHAAVAYPIPGAEEDLDAVVDGDEALEAMNEALEAMEAALDEGVASLGSLLAAADAGKGAKLYKKCGACHTSDQGGKQKVGPNLWNIVNRPVANVSGFKYSAAMAERSGNWSLEALFAFIADPKGNVPGTKMAFAGIKDNAQRADLLLFLRGLSGSPVALPAAE